MSAEGRRLRSLVVALLLLLLFAPCPWTHNTLGVDGFRSCSQKRRGRRYDAVVSPRKYAPQQQVQQALAAVVHSRDRRLLLTRHDPSSNQVKSRRLALLFPLVDFSSSLIGRTDIWGNWMILFGNAYAAQILGRTTSVGRLLGPPVSAMALTFFMATIGILPAGGTEASQSLQIISLQMATPLVLLGADLRSNALARCGPLGISFALASLATVLACCVGGIFVGPALQGALGVSDGTIIAAALMAKNIGGGINYMAVCSTLQASPVAIAAGLCVDNLFALVYFPITSYLAAGRPDPAIAEQQENLLAQLTGMENKNRVNTVDDNGSSSLDQDEVRDLTIVEASNHQGSSKSNNNNSNITVDSVTTVTFLSAALLWLGQQIGGPAGALPVCTLFTVLLLLASNGKIVPYSWIHSLQPSAQVMGTVALYVFFSTAGALGLAVADSVRASLLPLSLFLCCLYGIHGALLYVIHVWFQKTFPHCLSVPRLLCASSAAIGGPATAVALAQAANWNSLQVPGLLVGNIGYAVATFLGLAYHAVFTSS